MVNELAVGYVSIVPETSKIATGVARAFAGVERSAVGAGKRIGAQLAAGVKATPPVDLAELEQTFATAEKSRAATIKRTTDEIAGLRRKEAIAQAQLTEAEGKYASGSVQVLRAKDRLATASQKAALAEAKHELEISKSDKALAEAKAALDAGRKSVEVYAASTSKSGDTVNRVFRGIGTSITSAARGNWGPLAANAGKAFGAIARQANTTGASIGTSMGRAGATMGRAMGDAGRSVGETFRKLAQGDVAGAYADVKSGAATAASGVKSAFSRVGNLFGPIVKGGAKSGAETGQAFGRSATSAMKTGATTAGNVFKSTLGALLTSSAITGLFGSLKSAITSFIPEVAAASDATDKFKSTLDFAGLDTKTIDQLTKSTKDYADRTVYDLGDIQATTAQLAANGVKGYDKLAEAAGNLNAVAGGNADTFKSVGTVLTQTAGQGKLTTENFNQLADAIPGASGMLQEAMLKNGAYTGNFREAMEKGEITAEEFNQAIMDLGMTDAAIEAATATTAFEGAIGNLQATLVTGLMGPVDALKPAITTALGGVATMLEPIFGKIGTVVEGIAPKVEALAKRFSGWADGFTLDGVTSPLDGLRGVLDTVRDAVGGFIDGFGGVKGLADTFGPILGLITGPIGLLRGALGSAFDGVDAAGMGKGLASALKPVAQIVSDVGGTIQSALGDALKTILPVLGQVAKDLLPILGGALKSLAPIIGRVVSGLAPLIGQLVQQLAPVFTELVRQVLPPIISLLDTLVPVILDVVEAVVPLVSQLAGALVPVIGAVIGAIAPLIGQLVSQLAPIITDLVDAIIPPLSDILVVVADVISTVVAPVLSFLAGFLTGVLTVAFNLLTPVVKTVFGIISTVIKTVVGFITGVIKTGMDLINGGWRKAWDGIAKFHGAIWDGIKGGVSTAINAVKKTIGDVMGAVKAGWDTVWGGIKDIGSKAWTWIKDTATGTFDTMRGAVETTFTKMRDGIGTIWDGIKSVFAKPINAVIRFINEGIIGSYNWVADKFSMSKLAALKVLPGYQSGGFVDMPWSAANRDPYLGVSKKGMLRFEGEEFIVNRRQTRKYRGLLEAINSDQFDPHGLPGFAGGGRTSFRGHTFTALFAGLLRQAEQMAGATMRISQGGFRPRTSYSGTSHQGDAVDITGAYQRFIAPLRSLGIPTWDRAGKGNWVDHAHGVPLPGSGSAAGSAVWQAQDYLRGGDGLGGRDNGPRGGIIDSLIQGIKGAIAAGFSSVTEWFGGIAEKLTAPFTALTSAGGGVLGDLVVGIGNKLKDSLTDWVKETLGIGYAGGTRSAAPGLAWVGERGPELVRFRGGEQVIPAGVAAALTGGGGGVRIGELNLQLPDWVRDFDSLIRFIRVLELQAHRA